MRVGGVSSLDGRDGCLSNRQLPDAIDILPDISESPTHGLAGIRRVGDRVDDLFAHDDDGVPANAGATARQTASDSRIATPERVSI
jgi:hypothetical protein